MRHALEPLACAGETETVTSYSAVGRKYGVSDNAVRKWVRFYERQIERECVEAEGSGSVDGVRVSA
jgi:transposase-like protein